MDHLWNMRGASQMASISLDLYDFSGSLHCRVGYCCFDYITAYISASTCIMASFLALFNLETPANFRSQLISAVKIHL